MIKRINISVIIIAFILIGKQEVMAQDVVTANQITENMRVALGNETLYDKEIGKTKGNRENLLMKVSIRNVMKQSDRAARNVVGDLGREGAAYKMICKETQLLMEALDKLLSEAQKHSDQLPYVRKGITEVMAEGTNLVTQSINMAMGGKVENPFGNNNNQDGHNLMLQDERITICNNTISGLRRLRMATDAVAFKLGCEYTWREKLKETPGLDFYWKLGMEESFKNTIRFIDNSSWK